MTSVCTEGIEYANICAGVKGNCCTDGQHQERETGDAQGNCYDLRGMR